MWLHFYIRAFEVGLAFVYLFIFHSLHVVEAIRQFTLQYCLIV